MTEGNNVVRLCVALVTLLVLGSAAAGASILPINGGGDPPHDAAPAVTREEGAAGGFSGSTGHSSSSISFTESSQGLASVQWEGGPAELEFADWNADGNLDLLSLGDHGSPNVNGQQHGLMLYAGDGAGKWSLTQNGAFGYGGLGLGDLNGDGIMDLALGVHHDYAKSGCGNKIFDVCLGPDLTKNWSQGLVTGGETYGMFGTDVGDFDNDGWLDVGSNSFGCCAGVHMYRNNHDGTWVHTGVRTGGNSDHVFAFADIDMDGNLDAFATNEVGEVHFGDGKGVWKLGTTGLPQGFVGLQGISSGDIDGDGVQELIFINIVGQSERRLFMYKYDGTSWKNASQAVQPLLNASDGSLDFTQVGDVDLDGKLDIVVAASVGFVVLSGDGQGAFTRTYTHSVAGGISWWNAFRLGGDADHNGYPDIAGVFAAKGPQGYEANTVHFYANQGSGVAVSLIAPWGGEKYVPGSARFIQWNAGGTAPVKLEISTAGNAGPWTLIKDQVPNTGQFQWVVPTTPSKNCYVKVTASGGSATNAMPFEILGSTGPAPLVAQVTAPNGGETLTAGTSYDIGFSVSGGSMPASGTLELTTVGPSGPWTKIVDLTGLQSGAGKHAWTVTATPTTTAFVRLDVKDTSPTPQTAADTSNSAFTIVVPNNIVLDKVEITPATATVVVGKTAKFNAKAIDTKGAEIASATFTWVLSGNIGTLAPTGATADFTATTIGSGSIEVNAEFGADSRTAQAAVSVQAAASPPLGKVVLTPSSVSGSVGESVAIRARALDINGKEIIGAQFAWTVTGGVGTLDSTSGDQVNLALEQAGAGSVDVVASFEGKDVGAKATVTAKKPFVFPWELLLIVIGLLAAVVVAGMLFSWFRRKKREEERRQQAFIQRRYEQFQQSQYQSQEYGWGG